MNYQNKRNKISDENLHDVEIFETREFRENLFGDEIDG